MWVEGEHILILMGSESVPNCESLHLDGVHGGGDVHCCLVCSVSGAFHSQATQLFSERHKLVKRTQHMITSICYYVQKPYPNSSLSPARISVPK